MWFFFFLFPSWNFTDSVNYSRINVSVSHKFPIIDSCLNSGFNSGFSEAVSCFIAFDLLDPTTWDILSSVHTPLSLCHPLFCYYLAVCFKNSVHDFPPFIAFFNLAVISSSRKTHLVLSRLLRCSTKTAKG